MTKIAEHLDTLEPTYTSTGEAEYWSFKFKWGWAIFTVNCTTGEFSIQSDWGNYAYRWNTGALGGGMTLLEFIAQAEADYIVRKFAYDKPPDFQKQFSAEKTREAIEAWIKDGDSPNTELLLQQLGEFYTAALGGCRSFDEAYHLFTQDRVPCDLYDALDSDMMFGELLAGEPSGAYLMVRDRLLPFFQRYLRSDVLGGRVR